MIPSTVVTVSSLCICYQDLVSGLLERQGMINALIDDGNNFINDNSIPMDDRQTIHDKMSKVHDAWDELSDLVQERQRM